MACPFKKLDDQAFPDTPFLFKMIDEVSKTSLLIQVTFKEVV